MDNKVKIQQQAVDKQFQNLINCISESGRRMSAINTKESALRKVINNFLSEYRAITNDTQTTLKSIHKNVVWDHLVIGFFGQTNAGKSTLIESFRIAYDEKTRRRKLNLIDNNLFAIFWRWLKGLFSKSKSYNYGVDGEIVGDGHSDFTKQHTEYDMMVDGEAFTLIDVPGIEGNEKEYTNEIKSALLKAHCIFYVQGENKQPDSATAKKIQSYLSDWVSVYSVYNLRSSTNKYQFAEDRVALIRDGDKVPMLVQNTFRNILGDIYKGNITVQGLLALCGQARFSKCREDLIGTQQKLTNYFGSQEKVLEFSQFNSLMEVVKRMKASYVSEIVEANKRKYGRTLRDSLSRIDAIKKQNDESITIFSNRLSAFVDGIGRNLNDTKSGLKLDARNAVDTTFRLIEQYIHNCIDRADDPKDAKKYMKDSEIHRISKDNLSSAVDRSIQNRVKNLNDNIVRLKERLDNSDELGKIDLRLSFTLPNMNLDKALSELGVKFKDLAGDVLGWAGKGALLGTIVPGIGNIIGGIAGAVVGFFKSMFTGKDEKRRKAKNAASEKIREIKSLVMRDVDRSIDGVNSVIEDKVNVIKNNIRAEQTALNNFKASIDAVEQDLKNRIRQITQLSYGTI